MFIPSHKWDHTTHGWRWRLDEFARVKFSLTGSISNSSFGGLCSIQFMPALGLIFAALIGGTARNPSLRKELFNTAILGFALTEALGLFALMMALIFLYAF
jgi:F0F1-type ATP synthase membrane subunit c/vacuolar-type H+-ATPase subunit K